MSAPQPNESTQPTGRAPQTIPVPTTPHGAVQTMMSLLPHLGSSQGGASADPASSQESAPQPSESTQPAGRAPPTIPVPTTPHGAVQTMMSLFPHLGSSHGGPSADPASFQESAPQPNESTGRAPSTIPVPTTPLGAVQTMMSLFPHLAASQGGQPAHTVSPDTYAPASGPHAHPPPASATQFVPDITVPAPAASVSSHGGRPYTPPRTARVTRSTSGVADLSSYHPPRPVIPPLNGEGLRRSTATTHFEDIEGLRPTGDDQDQKESRWNIFGKPKRRPRSKVPNVRTP
jgi:hypothetical protein